MVKKIPINEHGEGNCCPNCNSLRILKIQTCYIVKEIKLNTGKEKYINPITNKISKMTNRIKAWHYDLANESFYSLKCEKCDWKSEIFYE